MQNGSNLKKIISLPQGWRMKIVKIAIMESNPNVVVGGTQTHTRRVENKRQGFCILNLQLGIIETFH